MAPEHVQRLSRLFELMSEPEMDWAALHELVDPDVVWEVRSDFPDAEVYKGYDGLRRLSAAFDDAVEQTWYRPLEFIETEDQVVVPLRWGGRGKGSQTPFAEREETWVVTLRDTRISRVTEYATKPEALEAVGLGGITGPGGGRPGGPPPD
jgi:ketosteroid isomerase-like protein